MLRLFFLYTIDNIGNQSRNPENAYQKNGIVKEQQTDSSKRIYHFMINKNKCNWQNINFSSSLFLENCAVTKKSNYHSNNNSIQTISPSAIISGPFAIRYLSVCYPFAIDSFCSYFAIRSGFSTQMNGLSAYSEIPIVFFVFLLLLLLLVYVKIVILCRRFLKPSC